jgi:hypothetical protein
MEAIKGVIEEIKAGRIEGPKQVEENSNIFRDDQQPGGNYR